MRRFLITLSALLFSAPALAAGGDAKLTHIDWSFSGPFGTFDQAALQRGFQVYSEVCASCHSLEYIAFRNLADLGYNEAEIKAIAAQYEVEDGPNDEGEMFMRPAIPADRFPSPYPNENAARAANGGAYPPDLSLMIKARPNGADYMYSLMTGYVDAPEGIEVPDGMYYNASYPGGMIAMPQPLYGEDVEYADGHAAEIADHAKDITAFLAWTAEPELESRKRIGVASMIFLLLMTVMSYFAMRFIWADVKKAKA